MGGGRTVEHLLTALRDREVGGRAEVQDLPFRQWRLLACIPSGTHEAVGQLPATGREHRPPGPVTELVCAGEALLVLFRSGECVARHAVSRRTLCRLNTSDAEVIRSLYYNQPAGDVIVVSLAPDDGYSSLACRAVSLRDILAANPGPGRPLFANAICQWPGYIELDDVNGLAIVCGAEEQLTRVYDLEAGGCYSQPLYEFSNAGVTDVRVAQGMLLLVGQALGTCLPLTLLGARDGAVLAELAWQLHPGAGDIRVLDIFEGALLVQQAAGPLEAVDMRSGQAQVLSRGPRSRAGTCRSRPTQGNQGTASCLSQQGSATDDRTAPLDCMEGLGSSAGLGGGASSQAGGAGAHDAPGGGATSAEHLREPHGGVQLPAGWNAWSIVFLHTAGTMLVGLDGQLLQLSSKAQVIGQLQQQRGSGLHTFVVTRDERHLIAHYEGGATDSGQGGRPGGRHPRPASVAQIPGTPPLGGDPLPRDTNPLSLAMGPSAPGTHPSAFGMAPPALSNPAICINNLGTGACVALLQGTGSAPSLHPLEHQHVQDTLAGTTAMAFDDERCLLFTGTERGQVAVWGRGG